MNPLDHPGAIVRRWTVRPKTHQPAMVLYELGKNTKDKILDDAFFTRYVNRIEKAVHSEENWVRDAMMGSLLSIGKRNATLNKTVIKAAKSIGRVKVDYGDNSCEPLDVLKHMTSEYLKKKLRASPR